MRALAARSTNGLSVLYQRYGPYLFDYCHALLRDQPTASRVLHDTLLAAEAHIERLPDPAQLRGWLYAIARRECRRVLRAKERPAQRRPAPEIPERFASAVDQQRYLDARRLAHESLGSLSGRQREAVDLTIRHGLSDTELAGVLGISLEEAAALGEGSRDDLAEAVSAKVGHDRIQLSKLLSVLPVAMAPADLESQVMATALDPELNETRAEIARRAAAFGADGWPLEGEGRGHRAPPGGMTGPQPTVRLPSPPSGEDGERRRDGLPPWLIPLGGVAVVVLLVLGVFVLMPGGGEGTPQSNDATEVVPTEDESSEPVESPTKKPKTSKSPTPTQSPSKSPSESPSASPTTAKPSPTPTATKPSTVPVKPGAALVAGCQIAYPKTTCTVRITAKGGPITWSAVADGELTGGGGGTLAAGRSAGVPVTVNRADPCVAGSDPVVFTPGGTVTVSWDCPPVEEPEDPDPDDPPPAN